MPIEKLVWFIPLLPIFGFLFNVFVGRHMPKIFVSIISCGTVGTSAILSWMAFGYVHQHAHDPNFQGIISTTFDWIRVPGLAGSAMEVLVQHRLVVDQLTSVMILVVTNVGFLIHLYSTGYMADEKRYSRYFSYLNLFTGFMLILVMASNLLLMFVGWEGVGLCSYLLIGFWFEKIENASAGMKAFIVNRVGDFAFTIGVLLLFVTVGQMCGVWTLDFQLLGSTIADHKDRIAATPVMTAVGILLFLGATGKSAQLPLYTWLPDAMAGPTPVSALIHAATMVTAGVYMIARMNFVFALSPTAMTVVAVVGGLTALFAGTIGLAQNDIKKVLAYSTVSQLGFMFMAVGVGAFFAGIFHLMTHAFFKACLFLGSGSVIHGMGGEQDIRKMGGLRKFMPITFWTFLIASVAIAGVPPLAGFWSKDEILWKAWSTHALAIPGPIIWAMGIVAAGFTAFYMTRLVVLTFFGELRSAPKSHDAHGSHDAHPAPAAHDAHGDDAPAHDAPKADDHGDHGHGHGTPHESPWSMTVPLVVLMLLSIAGGFIGMPHWIPGGGAFEAWLKPVCPSVEEKYDPNKAALAASHETRDPHAPKTGIPIDHDGEHHGPPAMELILMGVSVVVGLGGILWGLKVYYWGKGKAAAEFAAKHRELYELVRDKYRVDELYEGMVIEPILALNETAGRFDNAVVDGMVNGVARAGASFANATGYVDNEVVDGSVNATAAAINAAGQGARRIQTGHIRSYITMAVIGGLLIIALFCVYLQRDAIMRFFTKG